MQQQPRGVANMREILRSVPVLAEDYAVMMFAVTLLLVVGFVAVD